MSGMDENTGHAHTEQPLPGMSDTMPARPKWSAAEAARRCGVGRATIARALDDGRITGAQKTEQGWEIPVESLIAAGLRPTAPPAVTTTGQALVTGGDRHDARSPATGLGDPDLRARIASLTLNLEQERTRREQAEQAAGHAQQLADDRAHHIEHLATAMRLIEIRTTPTTGTPTQPLETPSETDRTTTTKAVVASLSPQKRWSRWFSS